MISFPSLPGTKEFLGILDLLMPGKFRASSYILGPILLRHLSAVIDFTAKPPLGFRNGILTPISLA